MPGLSRALSSFLLAAAVVGVSAPAQLASDSVPSAYPVATVVGSAPVSPTKVLLIVEENKTQASARKGMPFLAKLGQRYGHTTHYRALAHPSLPNYLALAGGSTFGVRDDGNPSAHRIRHTSVFDQAIKAHQSAKAYEESMPSNCHLTSTGRYAVRHNPWTYFAEPRSRANCRHHDVPAGTTASGALHDDVTAGTLPTIGMLTPNLCHNAHDCSLAKADHWLKGWIRVIRHGADWTSGRLAVVVTFDENDGSRPNTVLTTVLSPSIHQVTSATTLTHYSWTRYAESLVGARQLQHARTAHSLGNAFGL
jgi:acid phosphatase